MVHPYLIIKLLRNIPRYVSGELPLAPTATDWFSIRDNTPADVGAGGSSPASRQRYALSSDSVIFHAVNRVESRSIGGSRLKFLHYRENEGGRDKTYNDEYSPKHSGRNLAPKEHRD